MSEGLDRVVTHFDDVYQQLNAQAKRIGQMQQQADLMSATLGRARFRHGEGTHGVHFGETVTRRAERGK